MKSLLLLFALLLGATTLSAQIIPGPVRTVEQNGNQFVTLYNVRGFGGQSPRTFMPSANRQAVGDQLRNNTQSLTVPLGYKVTLYEDEGRPRSITVYPGNYPNLAQWWRTDFIKVETIPLDAPVAYLWDRQDAPDMVQGFGPGVYRFDELFNNDAFEELIVYGLLDVELYDFDNLGGEYLGLYRDNLGIGSGYLLGPTVRERVSSVRITPRTDVQPATINILNAHPPVSDYFADVEVVASPPTAAAICGTCPRGRSVKLDLTGQGLNVNLRYDFGTVINRPPLRLAIGPGRTDFNVRVMYNSGHIISSCDNPFLGALCGYAEAAPRTVQVGTAALKAPTLLEPIVTTNGSVILNWEKNSDVPEEFLTRQLIRDGVVVRTLAPDLNSFTVTNFPGTGPFEYAIRISYTESAGQVATSNTQQIYAPIGIIRGNVSTRPGGITGTSTGVAEVEVCAIEMNTAGEPEGPSYCGVTDTEGNYTIRNIYFGAEAEFRIVPIKQGHGFDPGFRTRTLSPAINNEANVDFADTTSFVLSGRIVQSLADDTCGIGLVQLLINGTYFGDTTDVDGYFNLIAPQAGSYTITPRLDEHTFNPTQIALEVDQDVTGLNIQDVTLKTLSGFVRAGCEQYLGQAEVRVSTPDGCMDTTFTTDAGTGAYEIDLPARRYRVEVLDITLQAGSGLDPAEVVGFFETQPIDLTDADSTLLFTYRKPPVIEVTGLEDLPCAELGFPVLDQYEEYTFDIFVWEEVGICPVDTGILRVIDNISEPAREIDLPIQNGRVFYPIVAGVPNIVAPHLQNISFTALVDGRTENEQIDAIVTGVRARERTFTTVTPELPLLILRDPPGDASSSYLESSQSLETALSFSTKEAENENIWAKVKVGTKFMVGFGYTTEFSIWGELGGSVDIGASTSRNEEFITKITSSERFSTSDNPEVTGTEGDVFVGGAMNIIYAIADEVRLNDDCMIETDESLIMGNDGFFTTYIYTEDHIRNVLIPDLNRLAVLNEVNNPDTSAFYLDQISVWQQTLQRNEDLKRAAVFIENKSFSANAPYTSTTTASSTERMSIEYTATIDAEVTAELGLEVAGVGVSGGAKVKMRMETGESQTRTSTEETTTGFTLSDNDQGDFFSVDIKADPVYKTPVFDLVSGRSSCPLEPRTQPRDDLQLRAENLVETNVDPDQAAVFRLLLLNTSQSEETRDYLLSFKQGSNPEGARVRVGGSEVQAPIPYSIPFGEQQLVTVEVTRGPNAFTYNDLEFCLTSACDPDVSNCVKVSAYFQTECSDISLTTPEANWVVNAADAGRQTIRLTDYNKQSLDRVIIEQSSIGTGTWTTQRILQPVDLTDQPSGTTINLDLSSLRDGRYELRAKLVCNQGFVFSRSVGGLIDRRAPEVFGVPQPVDGQYARDRELSVTFTEDINCLNISADDVVVQRVSDGAIIPTSVGCSGNKLIFRPAQSIFNQVGERYTIRVSDVADAYGNQYDGLVEWEFQVGNAEGAENTDLDGDGILNDQDNCPLAANGAQGDLDGDGIGDACDEDLDGDGVPNDEDNAPYIPNPDQADTDGNGIGDVAEPDADGDMDGVINSMDNCPSFSNANQADLDGDGIGDACDDDLDGDGILNMEDNCPDIPNSLQEDDDEDGVGNRCEGVAAQEESLLFSYLNVYPNPVNDVLNVELQPNRAGRYTIELYEATGRRIRLLQTDLISQTQTLSLQVEDLPKGMYYLRLSNGRMSFGKKVLVQ